jgi:hypothetical protein
MISERMTLLQTDEDTWHEAKGLGAITWIYNEFSCLARVRIRKAKVRGWGCNVDL